MPKTGTVYLIHFDKNLAHARHYIGYTDDPNVEKRVEMHRRCRGAKILAHLNRIGIGWVVVRIWENATREWERKLKNMNGASSICPVCNPTAMNRAKMPTCGTVETAATAGAWCTKPS